MLFLPLAHLLLGVAPTFALAPAPLAAGAAGVPAREPRAAGDVDPLLQEVAAWVRRFGQDREDGGSASDARSLIEDLELAFGQADEADQRELFSALLDLQGAALARRASRYSKGAYNQGERALLRLTERALRPKLELPAISKFLTREVLLVASRHSAERRAAGVRQYRPHQDDSALLALLQCAESDDELLRLTTLETLIGWPNETVHRAMVDRLGEFARSGAKPERAGAAPYAERHFQLVRVPAGSRSESRLADFVRIKLSGRSWREASLAIAVSNGLEAEMAVPILIASLELWTGRGQVEGGALRTQNELASALKARSGRNLGLRADRWATWWRAVEAGEIQLSAEEPSLEGRSTSTAGFFGVDPKSDRVTFVLDRSGSMDAPFESRTASSPGPHRTRYEEAIEQLSGFLEGIGEEGRFNVVLFNDRTSEWRTHLQKATPGNIKSVRKWLKGKPPQGGTMLYAGIHEAYNLDRRGELNLEAMEADTIIVICDGATTEGSGWVRPFLSRTNHEARVIFHSVQIGSGGDGTLELLASETGGEFKRIDR